MKFFCNTYHQERDESFCGFCSAACDQYDRFNKKIMKEITHNDLERMRRILFLRLLQDDCEQHASIFRLQK